MPSKAYLYSIWSHIVKQNESTIKQITSTLVGSSSTKTSKKSSEDTFLRKNASNDAKTLL